MNDAFMPKPRRRTRTVRLEVCVPPLNDYAWDVIHSIERRTIAVVDPTADHALHLDVAADGAVLLDSDATLSLPLADWLAVGCQRIRWQRAGEDLDGEHVCGVYRLNIGAVFGGFFAEDTPHGPGVAVAEIVLPLAIQDAWLNCRGQQPTTRIVAALQLVVAHELVHAFDVLKYLAPAWMNWPAFRRNVLGDGTAFDVLADRLGMRTSFVDDYGGPNELAMLKTWWPSRAGKWFKARRWLSMFGF